MSVKCPKCQVDVMAETLKRHGGVCARCANAPMPPPLFVKVLRNVLLTPIVYLFRAVSFAVNAMFSRKHPFVGIIVIVIILQAIFAVRTLKKEQIAEEFERERVETSRNEQRVADLGRLFGYNKHLLPSVALSKSKITSGNARFYSSEIDTLLSYFERMQNKALMPAVTRTRFLTLHRPGVTLYEKEIEILEFCRRVCDEQLHR